MDEMTDKKEIRKGILTLRNDMMPGEIAGKSGVIIRRLTELRELRGASGSMYAAAFPKAGG
jgi:hypothetical protein